MAASEEIASLSWAVALVFSGLQLAHPLATLGFLLGTAYVFSKTMRRVIIRRVRLGLTG